MSVVGSAGEVPPDLPAAVARWYARSTWHRPGWTVADLVAVKGGQRVAVVLPALNEETTVGGVVSAFMPLTGVGARLVDEIVVMDSGSVDRTAEVAAQAGARVVRRGSVLPDIPPRPGKGEVMWRALAATDADLVVYVDADLVDVDMSLVTGLLGPLLSDPGVGFVKAFYDRPLRLGRPDARADPPSGPDPDARSGGGRVTELLARPAIAVLAPDLAGVIQPLGGEYAARRTILEAVPFAAGYAVEIGLLLDVVDRFGLDTLAQVDVGVRKHRHRDLLSLGETAAEILLAMVRRRAPDATTAGRVPFLQFDHAPGGVWTPHAHLLDVTDRPPMAGVLDPGSRVGVGPSPP